MQPRQEDIDNEDPNIFNNLEAATPFMPDFFVRISIYIVDSISSITQTLRDYHTQVVANNRFTDALTRTEVDGPFLLDDDDPANEELVTDGEEEVEEEEEEDETIEREPFNPLQEKLEKAGFDSLMIRDHPKLRFFLDPVKLTIINNIVVTDTGEIADENTAKTLLKHHLRMTQQPIQSYKHLQILNSLIELLVDEAIADLKKENEMGSKSSTPTL